MTEPYAIRNALQEDVDRLAALAQRTFLDAFGDSNDPEDMAAYVAQAFSAKHIRTELSETGCAFFVAEAGNELLGYAKLRKGSDGTEGIGPSPVELQRIYVEAPAIGKGIGAALIKASMERAQAIGYRTMWLGVWEMNLRAVAFYQRWGFETIGEHVFRLGKDDQIDLVMARSI